MNEQCKQGLKYCQQRDISHRDIRSDNYLLDDQNKLILYDFSESLDQNEIKNICKSIKCNVHYMAPEIKQFQSNNTFQNQCSYNPYKSDLYSFGIVLIETCNLRLVKDQPDFLISKQLDQIQDQYGTDVKVLIQMMLQDDFNQRMDFIQFHDSKLYQQLILGVCNLNHYQVDSTNDFNHQSNQQQQQNIIFNNQNDQAEGKNVRVKRVIESEISFGSSKIENDNNDNNDNKQYLDNQFCKVQKINTIVISKLFSPTKQSQKYHNSTINLEGLEKDLFTCNLKEYNQKKDQNSRKKYKLDEETNSLSQKNCNIGIQKNLILNNNNEDFKQNTKQKERRKHLKAIQIKKDLKVKFGLLLESNLAEMKKEYQYQDVDIQNTEKDVLTELKRFFINIHKQNNEEEKKNNEKVLYQIIDKLQIFKKTLQDLKMNAKEEKVNIANANGQTLLNMICQ